MLKQWLQPQGILGRLGRHPAEMARYGPGSALENLSHEKSAKIEGLGLVALNGLHFASQPLCGGTGDSGLSRLPRPLS